MPDYEKLYHLLFNTATDAIKALEADNYAQAEQLLIYAQQEAETLYISEADDFPASI